MLDGVKICKENDVDVIVAVGGGSVLDCSKAIATGAKYDGDPWDLITYKAFATDSVPIVDIITLAATGSEYDSGGVISRTETNDKIGYIPQESVFLPQFTVLENIFLPRAIREGNKVDVRDVSELVDIDIHSKLETLGIAHLVNEMPAELSGGELKRASIVRALVNNPDIVIADEPTSNLDETNAKIVFDLLAELAQSGTSVLVATHDPRGFKYGDRIYTMHKGRLLPNGESDYGGL